MIVLIVFLLVFFILLLGMAAFEFARYSLCCQQFQHCVDIAALGGAAGLASSQTTNQAAAQSVAIQTAQWMMEQNYILDRSLNGMTSWSSGTTIPTMPGTKNRANMAFTWVDPETGNPTGVAGDQKVFRVSGCYAYPPMVGSWIGLGNSALAAVVAIGNGGGVLLDVVLCFDLSGSIDDSTKVSIVDRYYTGAGNKNQYRVPRSGKLYDACGATSPTGTSLNACFPQALNIAPSGGGNSQNTLLTWNANRHNPRCNAPPGTVGAGTGNNYTDIVVNLDENDTFGGGTFGGMNFPNVPTLVEAARGNLENLTVANNANVNLATLGVTPATGYYRVYWEQAMIHRHPLYDAQSAAANFFQIINNATNAHFGFVGFSSDENTTYSDEFTAGGQTGFPVSVGSPGTIPTSANVNTPIPRVNLSTTPGAAGSNFTTIGNLLPPNNPPAAPQLTANGSTDINGALEEAMTMLARASESGTWSSPGNLSRTGARRAIVLFTDGLPTADTGPRFEVGSPYTSSGQTTATRAGTLGIPIYCIGMAQISSLVTPMTNALTPIANNSNGKFYLVSNASQLDRTFSDIARSLVALTR